jgi:hypothetical protein
MITGALRTRLLGWLANDDRQILVLSLARQLTVAGRAAYVAAGTRPEISRATLECLNELQIVVLEQIAGTIDARFGYPDEAFLDVLAEKAAGRECSVSLERALSGALAESERLRSNGVGGPTGHR